MPTAPPVNSTVSHNVVASPKPSAIRGKHFWQNPFVNVIKVFGGKAETKGEVSEELDKDISKRVKRIYGSISANNYIRYPGAKSQVKSLELTGNYLYIVMRTIADRCFVIHIDVEASDGNNIRISMSNMFKTTKVQAPRTIQCPIHPTVDEWCVLCVYISGVIALYSPSKGEAKPMHLLPDVHFIKSIQIGASLLLRGIYTSDNHYLLEDMPREIQPTHKPVKIGWIELPINSRGEDAKDYNKVGSDTSIMTRLEPTSPVGTSTFKLSMRPDQQPDENKVNPNMESTMAIPQPRRADPISLLPTTSLQLKQVVCARPQLSAKSMSNARKMTASQRRFAAWVRDESSSQKPVVCASAAGHLSLSSIKTKASEPRLISGCGLVSCLAGADSGSTVITAETGTPPVVRLWRPTVSQTQPICIIACPMLAGIEDICSDADSKRICILGKDAQRKQQQLFLWSIPQPPSHTPGRAIVCKPAEMIAKQLCGAWPIQAMKFSPFRPWNVTSIVSCGFENIRFWRAKDQHLAGVSVQLNQLARDTVFTDLDFEASKSLRPAVGVQEDLENKETDAVLYYRVFVSTACGRVVQIHYNTRQIENVFRLHEDGCPIWSISVTEGFVCTAGGDGFVRVWPLDFANYYMQAKLPAPVYGLDLTPDDLQLLCSVGDGSVGVLDLESCKYTVVSRSHKSKIRSAALSSCGTKLCTAACDGSVRVWQIDNGVAKTLVEFKAESDTPASLAFQPPFKIEANDIPLLAVGFASGAVMLLEITAEGNASPAVELKQHAHPVTSISFASTSPATVLLLTGDATGRIVVHDEGQKFEATRCPDPIVSKPILPVVPSSELPQDIQVQPQTFVVRPGKLQDMIALYSHERCIALAQLPEFDTIRTLKIGQHQNSAAAAITAYMFSADGALLLVGLSDSWVRIYDSETGMLDHSINCVMSGMITALYMSCALGDSDARKIITAGHLDNQLRISDYYRDARSEDPLHRPNEQSYHAHHFPPRAVFAADQLLITVSSAEVCLWECPDLVLNTSSGNSSPSKPAQLKPESAQSPKAPRGEAVVVEGRGLFQSLIDEDQTGVPETQNCPEILEENCEPTDDIVEVARLDTADIVEEIDVTAVTKKVKSVERSEAPEKIKYKRFCGGGAAVLWLSELGHLATGCHRWVHLCNLVEDRDSYLVLPENVPGPSRVTSLDLSPLTMRTLLGLADDGRWMIVWDLARAGLAYSSQEDSVEDKWTEFVEPLSVTRLPRVGTACKLLADSLVISCGQGITDQEGNVAQLTVWGLPRGESCAEAKVLTTASLQLPDASSSDDGAQIVVNPLSAMEFVTMTSDSVIMWQLASSEIDDKVCGWGLAFNEVPLPEQHIGTLSSISISPPHIFIATTTGFVVIIDSDQCELLTAISVLANDKPPSFTKISSLPIPSKASIFTCLVTTDEDKLHSIEISKDLLGTWEAKLDLDGISFSEPIGSVQFYGSSNEGVVVTEGSASNVWFVDWDKRARARLRAMVPRSPVGLDSHNNLLAIANARDVVVYRSEEHGRIEGLTRYREARSEGVTIRCVTIISSDGLNSVVVGLSDGRARVYNLNPEKGQADYIQLDVFREVPLTAVAAFCGRRVLVGSGTGVLAWTSVPTGSSQAARLARLASAPAKEGSKPSVMQISVAPGALTFCASLSGGQLWAGCVRKQPAVRCVMQSTWTVCDLRDSVCLSQGRIACCTSASVLLYKIGTPVPVWTQSLSFSPSAIGRLGYDMIVVDGDGPKLTAIRVKENKGELVENLYIPIPWSLPEGIIQFAENETGCWLAQDGAVVEISVP